MNRCDWVNCWPGGWCPPPAVNIIGGISTGLIIAAIIIFMGWL